MCIHFCVTANFQKQESLFSKAYYPLAQQYFSAGLVWSSSTTTSRRGVLFHHHFWGVPCDLSHNPLIYHYRMPQCIMGKIHMGPPPKSLTDRQTNMCENITFPHTTYADGKYKHVQKLLNYIPALELQVAKVSELMV